MSGIFGLFNQDGAPVSDRELAQMASLLERRGPDRTGNWRDGVIGLGHTLLATTTEAAFEQLPLKHAETGCVVIADVRLDNRTDLLPSIGIAAERAPSVGDAEIILNAYLNWGEGCVERLLGDFAFAIWDPRCHMLLCARDSFGMRPLYYHHTPGRFFVFGSEPRAILALPQIPYRINEGRIADFLVAQLEGIDKSSTFFEEVYRLPPAHMLIVTPDAVRQRRYWTLEPGPELVLPSNEAYAEAFLDVFTEAVRCRLRSAGPVGSMLSGGMDSGSVVAVARGLLAEEGRGPLPTFSAVGPDPDACVETRTIHEALTMGGLDPHIVNRGKMDGLMPQLDELSWDLDEPFDNHMTLPRVIYLAAHRRGIKVILDGIGGDLVLSDGSHLSRLIRAGRWLAAYREAAGQTAFYGKGYTVWRQLHLGARTAFLPASLRRLGRALLGHRRFERVVLESMINRGFARRVSLAQRLKALSGHWSSVLLPSYGEERAQVIEHPYVAVGRERFGRIAAAVAVEPRDPFLDRRVAKFCLALPGQQTLSGGWPKAILRRAMADRVPDAVRWRRGKEHLGWSFTTTLMDSMRERMRLAIEEHSDIIAPYMDALELSKACQSYFDGGDSSLAEKVYDAAHLGIWLHRYGDRPRVPH